MTIYLNQLDEDPNLLSDLRTKLEAKNASSDEDYEILGTIVEESPIVSGGDRCPTHKIFFKGLQMNKDKIQAWDMYWEQDPETLQWSIKVSPITFPPPK